MKLLHYQARHEGRCLGKCLNHLLVFFLQRKDIYKEQYDKDCETYWAQMVKDGMVNPKDRKVKKYKMKPQVNIQEEDECNNNGVQEFDEAEQLKQAIKKIKQQLAEAGKKEGDKSSEEIMLIE
eukprot:TRINITY_DN8249_c0_g1_i1.p3 TRINITY_DN8249_c0_g1~~TRINITY_DN8249_c0_g1_i1.p3  ORF type:complete len:123 (+),score=28.34 TRINITY_DN8249_c0_g1_i1:141-509(+)